MRGWYYTDTKGVRQFEELDAEQAKLDEELVVKFQHFEGQYAQERDVRKLHGEELAEFQEGIQLLPPNREAHWVAELRRIKLYDEA